MQKRIAVAIMAVAVVLLVAAIVMIPNVLATLESTYPIQSSGRINIP